MRINAAFPRFGDGRSSRQQIAFDNPENPEKLTVRSMLHILHLEDRKEDAFLIQHALAVNGIHAQIALSSSRLEFVSALEQGTYDLILADNVIPGFGGLDALKLARQKFPNIPVI